MPRALGRYPSGQRGQTVNLLAYAFGGSNPPLPTIAPTGLRMDRTAAGLFQVGVAPAFPVNGPAVHDGGPAFRGNSSAVERQPSKLGVAGSNPVSRSTISKRGCSARAEGGLAEAPRAMANEAGVAACADVPRAMDHVLRAHVAQLAEHALGKGEVSGSIPDMGSTFSPTKYGAHGR